MKTRLRRTVASTASILPRFSEYLTTPARVEFFDDEHSSPVEARYAVIGLAAPGLMYVVFTERGEGRIRLIHARKADKVMMRIYESKD